MASLLKLLSFWTLENPLSEVFENVITATDVGSDFWFYFEESQKEGVPSALATSTLVFAIFGATLDVVRFFLTFCAHIGIWLEEDKEGHLQTWILNTDEKIGLLVVIMEDIPEIICQAWTEVILKTQVKGRIFSAAYILSITFSVLKIGNSLLQWWIRKRTKQFFQQTEGGATMSFYFLGIRIKHFEKNFKYTTAMGAGHQPEEVSFFLTHSFHQNHHFFCNIMWPDEGCFSRFKGRLAVGRECLPCSNLNGADWKEKTLAFYFKEGQDEEKQSQQENQTDDKDKEAKSDESKQSQQEKQTDDKDNEEKSHEEKQSQQENQTDDKDKEEKSEESKQSQQENQTDDKDNEEKSDEEEQSQQENQTDD
eukprot:CAMPEP_0194201732 /NCGR_PEP_ID=MMETSP0156-20130528/1935_1 /TAXON_ID=33649 /ORGANISM="Thalassionema nitzschioides, Strain L26-B" /LENGTH=365 /DNA_ID=CAMNT_0038927017 /DNA_START=35 /DNA_END=1129 /DNA_ORIENTATION=+